MLILDSKGRHPLHDLHPDGSVEVAEQIRKRLAIAEMLFAFGADMSTLDMIEETCCFENFSRLGDLIHRGHTSWVLFLIEKGYKFSDSKPTALITAVSLRNEKVLSSLLRHGVNPNEINSLADKRSALLMSSHSNWHEGVVLLIEHKANVHFADEFGETALDFSAQNRNRCILDWLLRAGARVTKNVFSRIVSGGSDYEILKMLLQTNTGFRLINQRIFSGGSTAVLSAARRNDFTAVSLLLQHGARISFCSSASDFNSFTKTFTEIQKKYIYTTHRLADSFKKHGNYTFSEFITLTLQNDVPLAQIVSEDLNRYAHERFQAFSELAHRSTELWARTCKFLFHESEQGSMEVLLTSTFTKLQISVTYMQQQLFHVLRKYVAGFLLEPNYRIRCFLRDLLAYRPYLENRREGCTRQHPVSTTDMYFLSVTKAARVRVLYEGLKNVKLNINRAEIRA